MWCEQQKEHTQHFPAAGQVEHCPREIWRNTQSVIRDCLHSAGVTARDVVALGITNQRETVIAWNRCVAHHTSYLLASTQCTSLKLGLCSD
jgi:glycerol kinase